MHKLDNCDIPTINGFDPALAEMKDAYPKVQYPLLEINVGIKAEPRLCR